MYLEFVLCSYIGGRGGDECIQLIKITKFLVYFPISQEKKLLVSNVYQWHQVDTFGYSLFSLLMQIFFLVERLYSGGIRSVPKIFDQFICSSLAVPHINSSHGSSNFEKFIKLFTISCLLTILTNQNAHK